MEKIKIAVCIPWDTPFVWTAPMFNMLNWERPANSEVNFIMGAGWCPASRHNDSLAKAQAWKADLIMFNGADHLCPRDIMVKMLARINEGWDMVQAMIPSRGVVGHDGTPFKAMSYKIEGNMPIEDPILHMPPSSVKILSYDDEPQESHICGTGDIMMKAEILDGLEKPYFSEEIKKDGMFGRYCVQDSRFVFRCTIESGARLFCDTGIRMKHLDIFAIDETYSDRFKEKTNQFDWSPARELKKYV
jgi:hypothetical protein